MTSRRSYLLEAPEDIRFLIYKAYVAHPDGLFYEFETGGLRTSDNKFIELALMRTCKLVALEMDGLFLRENTITFTTYYSKDLSDRIAKWKHECSLLTKARQKMLAGAVSSLAATNALDGILPKFPWFRPALEQLLATTQRSEAMNFFNRDWLLYDFPAPAPSIRGQVILYALKLASAAGETFTDEAFATLRRIGADLRLDEKLRGTVRPLNLPDPFKLLSFDAHPWIIPDDEDVARVEDLLKETFGPPEVESQPLGRYGERASAASCAIRFLGSLPSEPLALIRNLHLVEDRPANNDGYSHAQGLIPFCIANPRLRITRRVLFWDNMWAASPREDTIWGPEIRAWIYEAAVLPMLGMPADSFCLLFDGQNALDQAAEVFHDFVHRDEAWEQAIDMWDEQHSPPRTAPETEIETDPGPVDFGQVLADISAGKSFIRCNFDPGQPWDVHDVFKGIQGLTRKKAVDLAHKKREPKYFNPRPPLPSREELVRSREGFPNDDDHVRPATRHETSREMEKDSDVESVSSISSDRSSPTQEELEERAELYRLYPHLRDIL